MFVALEMKMLACARFAGGLSVSGAAQLHQLVSREHGCRSLHADLLRTSTIKNTALLDASGTARTAIPRARESAGEIYRHHGVQRGFYKSGFGDEAIGNGRSRPEHSGEWSRELALPLRQSLTQLHKVKYSDLVSKEDISDSLTGFVSSAKQATTHLSKLGAGVGGAVDS